MSFSQAIHFYVFLTAIFKLINSKLAADTSLHNKIVTTNSNHSKTLMKCNRENSDSRKSFRREMKIAQTQHKQQRSSSKCCGQTNSFFALLDEDHGEWQFHNNCYVYMEKEGKLIPLTPSESSAADIKWIDIMQLTSNLPTFHSFFSHISHFSRAFLQHARTRCICKVVQICCCYLISSMHKFISSSSLVSAQ
jgi:hypothetical protein